jgi:hypothetical protein
VNDAYRRRSPDGFDDDAIFADIVAHLKDEAAEPAQHVQQPVTDEASADHGTIRKTPGEAGEAPEHKGEQAPEDPTDETALPPPADSQSIPAPEVWRAHHVDQDQEEDHFEPLPVTPLPVGDLQFWAIIAGMVGGPLLLVYLVFFNRNMSSYWTLAAIAMSIGGFVLLVSRLPGHGDDEDDGARL